MLLSLWGTTSPRQLEMISAPKRTSIRAGPRIRRTSSTDSSPTSPKRTSIRAGPRTSSGDRYAVEDRAHSSLEDVDDHRDLEMRAALQEEPVVRNVLDHWWRCTATTLHKRSHLTQLTQSRLDALLGPARSTRTPSAPEEAAVSKVTCMPQSKTRTPTPSNSPLKRLAVLS